jgi:translation initiation factor IF-1
MEFFGVVVNHSRDVFRIKLDGTGDERIIKAKISGKMRLNKIDIQVEDRVKVEVSPYDTTQGRITSRLRNAKDQRAYDEQMAARAAASSD